MSFAIRPFIVSDFTEVKEIYQQGIDTKNAAFETTAPEWNTWDNKFIKHPRLVAIADNAVAGCAALSQVSPRPVYSGVCEVSIYVHPKYREKGIGRQLLSDLIHESEENNIWTLQASIFPENAQSIHMHKRLGFREVGYREKIGKMDDRWRDTVLLERRSKNV